MVKCLLWGTGRWFMDNIQTIRYLEMAKEIKVVGVTSNENQFKIVMGYRFIDKEMLDRQKVDYVIAMVSNKLVLSVIEEAMKIGFTESQIIPIDVMKIPGFDFEKYKRIKENIPTIISPNCWGGMIYNRLGLRFNSPFINMFESAEDYLKILKNLHYYLSCPLELIKMKYNETNECMYPLVKCGDVELHFNHYNSFEEVKECWARRSKRINWDKLIVMFYDDNTENIREFIELPFENKICFVSSNKQKFDDERIVSLEHTEDINIGLWKSVNSTAEGFCFDLFEFFSNQKIELLIDYENVS